MKAPLHILPRQRIQRSLPRRLTSHQMLPQRRIARRCLLELCGTRLDGPRNPLQHALGGRDTAVLYCRRGTRLPKRIKHNGRNAVPRARVEDVHQLFQHLVLSSRTPCRVDDDELRTDKRLP